jgi:hypothetical protein
MAVKRDPRISTAVLTATFTILQTAAPQNSRQLNSTGLQDNLRGTAHHELHDTAGLPGGRKAEPPQNQTRQAAPVTWTNTIPQSLQQHSTEEKHTLYMISWPLSTTLQPKHPCTRHYSRVGGSSHTPHSRAVHPG